MAHEDCPLCAKQITTYERPKNNIAVTNFYLVYTIM